jgi:sugar/nucleoside kinase (ribokinase family)
VIADLVTAGEAFEDLIFADLSRLPRAGEEIKTGTFARTFGGGALITAVAARRAGMRCQVVSALSAAAEARLKDERIAVTNLRRPGEPEAVTAALSTSIERTFVTFTGVNAVLEPRLQRACAGLRARHVHFAFAPATCARWLPRLRAFRRAGIRTSWDFGWNEHITRDKDFKALVGALDYAMMNEQEARLFTGARTTARAVELLREWARVAIVKYGPGGSRWISAGTDLQIAAPRVRAIDTTGAGDAFNGGFLAALLRGASPARALAAGNTTGARSTRALGGIDGL